MTESSPSATVDSSTWRTAIVASVTAIHGEELVVCLDRGPTVALPASYLRAGHLTYAYATTIHKAQGMTCDQTLVLANHALFREAGYTALSRGRKENRLYVVAPDLPDVDVGHGIRGDSGLPLESLVSALEQSRSEAPRARATREWADRRSNNTRLQHRLVTLISTGAEIIGPPRDGVGTVARVDDIDDALLADALAKAAAEAATQDFQSVVSVASALRAMAGGDEDPIRALIAALEFHLVLDEERRVRPVHSGR